MLPDTQPDQPPHFLDELWTRLLHGSQGTLRYVPTPGACKQFTLAISPSAISPQASVFESHFCSPSSVCRSSFPVGTR
jgi:hypothetical protein